MLLNAELLDGTELDIVFGKYICTFNDLDGTGTHIDLTEGDELWKTLESLKHLLLSIDDQVKNHIPSVTSQHSYLYTNNQD